MAISLLRGFYACVLAYINFIRSEKLEQGPIFLITFAERGRGRDMADWDVV